MSDDLDDLARDPANVVREGAASDGAEAEQAIMQLPRLLRYAHLALHGAPKERILAEIVELVPEEMVAAAAWSEDPREGGWMALAGRLDAAAVQLDQPILRTLSDAVRLTSMSIRDVKEHTGEALRVVAALQAALREADTGRSAVAVRWLTGTERMLVGWSVLIGGDRDRYVHQETVVHRHAYGIGKGATHFMRQWEEQQFAERDGDRRRREAEKAKEQEAPPPASAIVPDGHVLVCPPLDTKTNPKLRDACRGHEHAIGHPMPLAPMPDISQVRRVLTSEFPYAEAAIDALLAPLIGRTIVTFPPVVLVGAPGAGKSRLARRLAEALGVGLWRTDGARADGASFGGTDRR